VSKMREANVETIQSSYGWIVEDDFLQRKIEKIQGMIAPYIQAIERRVDLNQWRVLQAFREAQVSDFHLHGSTGYGYNDKGREIVDQLYASIFGVEAALVRPHIVSGTHAIALAFYGNLRPGDELIYATGDPYDTLQETIGICGNGRGSLREYGIGYDQIPLFPDGSLDTDRLLKSLTPNTRMIAWQRSSGYAWRPSLAIQTLEEAFNAVKQIRPDIICFVDNCYGEFVEEAEPTHRGADLAAGSLIKNPGGGLAPAGGYVIGKREWVEGAARRLTAPGIGGEAGATFDTTRPILQGLFLAPHVVGEATKGAIFTAALLEECGLETKPLFNEPRSDIIQAIRFGDRERMLSFCRSIQSAAPIDSHVRPEPWAMPGYEDKVVMAAGTFVQGSSIELSADGPLRPPYIAYLQGGLTYSHAKIATVKALIDMRREGLI